MHGLEEISGVWRQQTNVNIVCFQRLVTALVTCPLRLSTMTGAGVSTIIFKAFVSTLHAGNDDLLHVLDHGTFV